MTGFHVDYSLCRLAAIAVSKHLWKYSYIRDALKSLIAEDSHSISDVLPPDRQTTVTRIQRMRSIVSSVVKCFIVPEPIKGELILAVETMGLQICGFTWKIKEIYRATGEASSLTLSEFKNYVDYVCWTDHGFIDYPKTVRSLYISNMLPDDNVGTWALLAKICVEDCIYDFWPKISNIDRDRWKKCNSTISSYWKARLRNDLVRITNMLQKFPRIYFYEEAYSLEENMFINVFVRRAFVASQYFWELLEDYQKQRTIATICEKVISDDPFTQNFKDLFLSERGLCHRPLIFFLKQLSYYHFDDIRIKMLSSAYVLRTLATWPHDHLFLKTLKEVWTHHESIDYGPIMPCIIGNFCDPYGDFYQDVRYHKIFYEIWMANPKNLKESINYPKFLYLLWQVQELEILNYILRDETLNERRKEFLDRIAEVYVSARTDGYNSTKFLEKFVTKVLISEEEREWFRGQITLGS